MLRMLAYGLILSAGACAVAGEPVHPVLVPPVKEVRWTDGHPITVAKGTAAIVLGGKAVPAEQVAADMLQRSVARRFGQTWAVAAESDDLSKYSILVLLGQRDTNGRVATVLRERRIDLGPGEPGLDRYAIDVAASGTGGTGTTILVAGNDARGVTYGQDTLFQMLRQQGDELQLAAASIRDWASIPWRGRPQTDVHHYLQPGAWDCLVASRLNWIDLRNGTYAYEPDYKFTEDDKSAITTVIGEAHKRDMLVFGAVNCGISSSRHDAAMNTFRQFLAWGADGLWISFDDKGPGDAPEEITYRVLELGRQHGITGNRIAITPPKGSYQTVLAPFNRLIMRVPGMEDALWFWTPLPGEQTAADARSIGLRTKPSWWHNWPRPKGGFAHFSGHCIGTVAKHSYLEIPSLAVGWHEPSYEMLAPAAQYLQSAVPWGGNEWPQYYIAPTLGWWSWCPEKHDWAAAPRGMYGILFGPQQAAAMTKLDDTLARAKSLFAFGFRASEWRPNCPARLKDLQDRPAALQLLNQCEALAAKVAAAVPNSTLLDADRVAESVIAPMQQEVRIGRACAGLEFPEYWWDEHQRQVLNAVHGGDAAKADGLIAEVRPRLTEDLARIGKELVSLSISKGYVHWWTKTGSMTAGDWKQALAKRQHDLPPRVWNYAYYGTVLSKLLADLPNVPTGRGRGAAQRQMRIMATVLPEVREQYWGDWIAGIHKEGNIDTAVFAMEPGSPARAGDYGELPVRIPIRGQRDRLGLLLYMNRWQKESLGLEMVPGRWSGYLAAQLLWGDKVVWQADLGLSRQGCEWDLVKLPPVPPDLKELSLRLRVVEQKDSGGMHAIVFVGPIHLVEMPD